MKCNTFYNYLGKAGTTAAAMVIKDLILEDRFDYDFDAGQVLTSVAYHIRRPNTQLIEEYAVLLNWTGELLFSSLDIQM